MFVLKAHSCISIVLQTHGVFGIINNFSTWTIAYYFFMILAKWFFNLRNFDASCFIWLFQGFPAFETRAKTVFNYQTRKYKVFRADVTRCSICMRHHVLRHQFLCLWCRFSAVWTSATLIIFNLTLFWQLNSYSRPRNSSVSKLIATNAVNVEITTVRTLRQYCSHQFSRLTFKLQTCCFCYFRNYYISTTAYSVLCEA